MEHQHTHSHNDQEKEQHGHNKQEGHHTHDFLKRFWVSLITTIPILLLSPMIKEWGGFDIVFPGRLYVLLALSAFLYVYGGMPFLKGMVHEIKRQGHRHDAACGAGGVAVVFGLKGMDFFGSLPL